MRSPGNLRSVLRWGGKIPKSLSAKEKHQMRFLAAKHGLLRCGGELPKSLSALGILQMLDRPSSTQEPSGRIGASSI